MLPMDGSLLAICIQRALLNEKIPEHQALMGPLRFYKLSKLTV